ncbi:hypothetical protein RHMOL_Rhmol07G0305700 [Rhododendron molle]|uniref:Uncharacterized protein n=1 Tax=Rhododendron molle TaxID=49168 RepID=A0ACC0N8G7_RHOML|nr:hypothetical protein RHMOL_Rhmol07G0305700 [Rhododendron molle]
MEEEERERRNFDDLCPDLIDAVLRRAPLLSRTRLKPVSKSWCHLITTLRHSTPPTTSSGLVIFYRQVHDNPTLHQSSLLRIQNSKTLSVSSTLSLSYPWLLDSCNGLVLYAKKNETHGWVYCVYSPVLSQHRILPHRNKSEILARESLAFDGSQRGNFKVVCFFFQDIDFKGGKIECQIFSSATGDWREIEAPLINSFLLTQIGFQLGDVWGQSVYRNGKLYWVWSRCMLVFDEDQEFFELVELPMSKETGETKGERKKCFSRMKLWVSEGQIYYCESTEEGYRVWKYCDNDSNDDDKWQAKRLIVVEKLKLRKIETVNWFGEKIKVPIQEGCIWPCAFNEDLQLLFFQVGPGTLYSYSFETGEFEEVWGCGNTGQEQIYPMSCVCPFLFNSVNLLKRVFDAG